MPDENELNNAEHFLPVSKVDFEMRQSFSSLIKIDFGALSDVGKVRKNNEDAFLIFRTGRYWQKLLTNLSEDVLPDRNEENAYAMAVADGMGGRAAGEVASSMALVTVVNLMFSSVKWALKLDHPELRDQEIQEGIERAVEYLSKADFAISKRAEADPSLTGMGSTLTACYSFGDDLFVFHIGDSRAYLFRDGKLTQLTRDHTLAQGLADAGAIPQEKVQGHHFKHMLTRAIGRHGGNVEVEIHRLTLADNDQVLLCSDGLTDLVSSDEIAATLRTATSSQKKCNALINLALENGGHDNVTALLAYYRIPQENE
jgi:serine/threonine protein phosphatase PrpC